LCLSERLRKVTLNEKLTGVDHFYSRSLASAQSVVSKPIGYVRIWLPKTLRRTSQAEKCPASMK
jgi:hypothetical protein